MAKYTHELTHVYVERWCPLEVVAYLGGEVAPNSREVSPLLSSILERWREDLERWCTLERETLPSPKAPLLPLFLYNEALIRLRRSLENCKDTTLELF